MKAPESLSLAPDLPPKFIGGDPCLDFVNTVDWTPAGLVNERLVDYRRLLGWGERAGVVNRFERVRLARVARGRPDQEGKAYAQARWGRWVLQRLLTSMAVGRLSPSALELFNALAHRASAGLSLARADRAAGTLAWRASTSDDLDLVLWKIVRTAERLVTSDDVSRLRVCGGPDCGWLYVDRSRNGLRRWCEMRTCGTLAKSFRRTARRRAAVDAAAD